MIQIYDTLTKGLRPLEPTQGKKVRMFVCGPTVYDYSHLGHGKTYTQFDFIARYLRYRGYEVTYLQNITNIDDKIIARAQEGGIQWEGLTREYEGYYHQDMQALHISGVSKYARATDYIQQIIAQVQALLDKGHAYVAEDGVYFEVATFEGYGKLSGRTHVEEDDARTRIDESQHKRGWNDFALWKFAKPGEPEWEAPFGKGRPGWHIEDTAITEAEFGPQYELHGGAIDLIFPHHEAELTQMEAVSGVSPMVQVWMHGGFLNTGNRKMGKSLGNFTTLREALAKYDYRALRYLYLSAHYRSPLEFSEETLQQAAASVGRLDEFTFQVEGGFDDAASAAAVETTRAAIESALDNDFNTPAAWAAIHEFIKEENGSRRPGKRVWALLGQINEYFGVFDLEGGTNEDPEIGRLVELRDKLRGERQFAEADRVREQLSRMGVKLYDTDEGTKWRRTGSQ